MTIKSTILSRFSDKNTPILSVRFRNDTAKTGEGDNGYISGVVTEGGVAVSRRVFCYYRRTGELIRVVRSDEQGLYRINGLRPSGIYYLTSVDNNDDGIQYNAVTQDLIVASEVAL